MLASKNVLQEVCVDVIGGLVGVIVINAEHNRLAAKPASKLRGLHCDRSVF